jgi:hypothetical protein
MISGQIAPLAAISNYLGFEAVHIFPQEGLTEWISRGFQNSITDQSDHRLISSSKIHSPQNGLLLSGSIHALFDDFDIFIDPDVRNLAARQVFLILISSPVRTTTGLSLFTVIHYALTVAPSVSLVGILIILTRSLMSFSGGIFVLAS